LIIKYYQVEDEKIATNDYIRDADDHQNNLVADQIGRFFFLMMNNAMEFSRRANGMIR
jgi:hypothetical protein